MDGSSLSRLTSIVRTEFMGTPSMPYSKSWWVEEMCGRSVSAGEEEERQTDRVRVREWNEERGKHLLYSSADEREREMKITIREG